MKHSRQVRRYKPVDYLPASELARFGRCEHLVEIERKHGQVVSERGEAARRAGIAEHLRFHKQVTSAHNRNNRVEVKGRRGPCFVASAVYGHDDSRTDELRAFRDQVLLRTKWTAWSVVIYYAISPPLARWLSMRPRAAALVANMLDWARTRMVRPLLEKGSDGEHERTQ
ncbi:CFI-box-CTERM domain-containing protein [Xanthomonas hortorum]|uniref:CFI-box-CTERM domain-containing protein n=1 Tax=Xanthomonas hortorum TaxID=56454 RepID=UPI003CCD8C50